MSGFGRHRLLQLLIDAGIVALSWFLAFELRFDQGLPVFYDTLLQAHDPDRRRDQDRRLPPVRLPPPLVALRVGERHVGRRARRRCRVTCRGRHGVPRLAGAQRAAAALDRGHGSADHDGADRRSASVCADRDRASTRWSRGARSRGDRRRSRAMPAGLSSRRCSARGCSATRRSASSTTIRRRRTCASSACASWERRPTCRASCASSRRTSC